MIIGIIIAALVVAGFALIAFGFTGWDRELWGVAGFGLLFVAVVVLSGAIIMSEHAEDERLVAECLQYRKEYECRAMLRRPETTVIPMVVPVPMGR